MRIGTGVCMDCDRVPLQINLETRPIFPLSSRYPRYLWITRFPATKTSPQMSALKLG